MEHLAIFIHVAVIGRYNERINQYLDLIKSSKLYDNIEKIFICYVGDTLPLFNFTEYDTCNKLNIIKVSNNLQDYELPTQQYMYTFCKEHPNYKVLYIHTKGITGEINPCIEDWVSYMIYFLINKWRICVDKLNDYVSVGVDLRDYPTLHYSGNVWWTTSNHILSLPQPHDFANIGKYPNPLNSPRHNQEFWICYDKDPAKHIALWESNINCFERHLHRYSPTNYM
jgi:hypothetical protein